MRKRRFSEEQIVGVLKEAEAGVPVKELCRRVGHRLPVAIGGRVLATRNPTTTGLSLRAGKEEAGSAARPQSACSARSEFPVMA